MGLGGYLASRTDHDDCENELARELRETEELSGGNFMILNSAVPGSNSGHRI